MSRVYYVSMLRGRRVAYLAGPLPSHAAALALVEAARRAANRADPWSAFDAFGTCSMEEGPANPVGVLNAALGVTPGQEGSDGEGETPGPRR